MEKIRIYSIIITILLLANFVKGQDLMDELNEEIGEHTEYIAYTFKSTRILNGHSNERMQKRQLDFRINHRFGEINSGAYELWGLDNALISFSFEYGITDWVMVGIRRGTYQKTYDGFVKFTLWRQSKGAVNMPVAISYFADLAIPTIKNNDPTYDDKLVHRLSYTHQVLVARKFNEALSLQLTPTYVHHNEVDEGYENDIFAVGFGGRYKFTRRVALMFEYFWSSAASKHDEFYNPLALGFDIETGGHVFQLFVCNSTSMVESNVISRTRNSWGNGEMFFGFNISRAFAIKKKTKQH